MDKTYLTQKVEAIADKLLSGKNPPFSRELFVNCFGSTLLTTVNLYEDDTAFVITGDIPAMWLRDSSAQVNHYIAFAKEDEYFAKVIEGLLKRQAQCVMYDPYANAFNKEENGASFDPEDLPKKLKGVWEKKYEIDSLCYPIRLAHRYYSETGRTCHLTPEFKQMCETIIDLWITEQHHENSPYYFIRENCPESDTLPHNGKGNPVAYTGMTWSGFRPSDDACKYGYLIPSNMFAVVVLGYVMEFAKTTWNDDTLYAKAEKLRGEIDSGIKAHGIVKHPQYGDIYAYEADGIGNHNLMDDANVPSLLSIPYLGYTSASDPIYQNTRRFILSDANPYYYSGSAASGIGSPHTPDRYIWHIALSMQGLTAESAHESAQMLQTVINTTAGTNFMHEGFHVDDPSRFTRPWFAWANSLAAELMIHVLNQQ